MQTSTAVTTAKRLGLLSLLGLVACGRSVAAPPAPHPTDRPGVEVRNVELMNRFLQLRVDIPKSPAGAKPVVISLLDVHEPLTDAGMVVATYRQNWDVLKGLAPEPPPEPAENTVGSWLLAAPTPKTVGQGWFGMIGVDAETAIPEVLRYLETLPEVDMSRVAVMGSSTKGFAALRAAADRRIAVAVVLAACGDYHTFLHLSALAMNGAPLDLDLHYDAELRRLEPIRHPRRFTHAAILMMNGTKDTAVPIACARTTARAFVRAYTRAGVPERFRFVAIEGAAHSDLGNAATADIAVWLHRWLRPVPPTADPFLLPRAATSSK
jgi:hypothetical protein